jgi:hypothetical protein
MSQNNREKASFSVHDLARVYVLDPPPEGVYRMSVFWGKFMKKEEKRNEK